MRRAAWQADEGGNLLIVAGVFLVVGFVLLASTLSHLQGRDAAGGGAQREGVVMTLEDLLTTLEASLNVIAVKGQTNITEFLAMKEALEAALKEESARSGMHIEFLADSSDPSVWRRPDRCYAYSAAETRNGVVVGFAEDDFKKTIAGVSYLLHGTDGKEAIRVPHYSRLHRCVHEGFTQGPGTATVALGSVNQNHGPLGFLEEYDWSDLVRFTLQPSIVEPITASGWVQEPNIRVLDNQDAKLVSSHSSVPGNHITFYLQAPDRMPANARLEAVQVDVRGHMLRSATFWVLELQVFHPAGASVPFVSLPIPLTTMRTTHTLTFPDGPSGPGWTKEEIEGSRWRFRLNGAHEPSQEMYIDHFRMRGESMLPRGYRLDVGLDWAPVVEPFRVERLEMQYHVPVERTAGEVFHVQVLDPGVGWITIEDLFHTADPVHLERAVADYAHVSAAAWDEPRLRIVDSIMDDGWPIADQDVLNIDFLLLHAQLLDL